MTVACVPNSPALCLAPPASTQQHDERCRELLWGAPPDLMSQIMAFLSSLIQTWDGVFNPFDASHKLRGWSLDFASPCILRRPPPLNAAEVDHIFCCYAERMAGLLSRSKGAVQTPLSVVIFQATS